MLLVCNWLHSVGENHFLVMILLYKGSNIFKSLLIQSYGSISFCTDPSQRNRIPCFHSDVVLPSERCDISSRLSTLQASSVQTMRTFRLDIPLCQEPSNCSSLHLSGLLSNTSGRSKCSTGWKISFQNTNLGRQLQPSGRRVPILTLSFIR
jgi:hypothetical protein